MPLRAPARGGAVFSEHAVREMLDLDGDGKVVGFLNENAMSASPPPSPS